MKKMSLIIAATFAASLYLAGMAIAESATSGGGYGASDSSMESGSSSMGASGSAEQSQSGSQAGMQSSQQAGQQQMSSDQIRQLQQQLQAQGYNPGSIDGKMGPKTSQALRQFQQAQGITASGKADSQTLQALGVQGGEGQQEFMGVSPGFESEQQEQQQQPSQPSEQQPSQPSSQPSEPSQQPSGSGMQQQTQPPSGSSAQ
jgi:peptidoglycan hydrolase-like protein with peptidoglycan-binding domain